ncbi:hypothetical protein O9992_04855 [Vibrio lentus]|nr:hypothetical protein [Vibrio lentus]
MSKTGIHNALKAGFNYSLNSELCLVGIYSRFVPGNDYTDEDGSESDGKASAHITFEAVTRQHLPGI